MTTNRARFTIDGSPSEDPTTGDRGYVATNGQTLDITLEESPSTATRVTYSVFDPDDSESPLASKGATELTFVASSLPSETPSGVNDTVQLVLPGSGVHSWLVRAVATHAEGADVFERLVAIRAASGERKTIPAESQQFGQRGWSDAQNESVDATGGGGGGLAPPADPGDDGTVPIAASGDLVYLAGAAIGQVLTWDGSTWVAEAPQTVLAISDEDTILSLGHINRYLRLTHASPGIEVPPNTDVAIPVSTVITGISTQAAITFTAGSGVTINKPPTRTLATFGAFSTFSLKKVGTNEWDLTGDLAVA